MNIYEVAAEKISLENLDLNYRLYYEKKMFEGELVDFYGVTISTADVESSVKEITSSGEVANYLFTKLCEGTVTPVTLEDCVYEFIDSLYTLDR